MSISGPRWADDVEGLLRKKWKVGQSFTITEVYAFIPDLKRSRPAAQNVEARIRDALQQLKHRGKVAFANNRGRYTLRG